MARRAARPAARHRRGRRLTPRRWLPFAALLALVVGAVMVSSEEPPAPPAPVASVLDTTRMPSVDAPDAIASSWYCAGGTATGDGIAELSLVLANDDRRGATAEITLMGPAGKRATTQVDVPAHGRARVRASELIDTAWVGAVVEVRGGRVGVDREVTGPLGFDSSPCSSVAGDHWFVPSGSTVRGADEYLTIFNPFPDSASVSITFATDRGRRAPRPLRALTIPGRSVRTVDVDEVITNRSEVAATVVTRSGRVVVDRVQTYDGQGEVIGIGDDAIVQAAHGFVEHGEDQTILEIDRRLVVLRHLGFDRATVLPRVETLAVLLAALAGFRRRGEGGGDRQAEKRREFGADAGGHVQAHGVDQLDRAHRHAEIHRGLVDHRFQHIAGHIFFLPGEGVTFFVDATGNNAPGQRGACYACGHFLPFGRCSRWYSCGASSPRRQAGQ